jgi:transglutaminase/protease-like cytokinesis protein 3
MATPRKIQAQKHKKRLKKQNSSSFTNLLIFVFFLGGFLLAIKNNQKPILPNLQEGVNSEILTEKVNAITNIISPENIELKPEPKPPEITTNTPITSAVYQGNYDHIDQATQNVNYSGNSVSELANILSKYAQTEAEKARIIYSWIAYNIKYDVPSYLSGNFSNIEPADVLKYRLAVCSGYANLYQELAKEMGLESVTINGYSKGIGYIVGNSTELNHGWNGVKIDGNWYLIDVTWGAGHIENNNFVAKFNPFYFATPPEQFIYDHLPEKTEWQLLANPFTREKFESLPETSAQFFTTGLKFVSHTTNTIETSDRVAIILKAPPNIITTARLSSGENIWPDNYTFVEQSQGNIIVNASFPKAGNYKLQIFAKNRGDSGQYPHVITYKIIANSSGEQFPKTYSTLTENNGNLASPLTYSLPKNQSVYFQVSLENAVEVQVYQESVKQWTKLTRSGKTFAGNVFIQPGKVQIMAKFPGETNRYWSLAEYN